MADKFIEIKVEDEHDIILRLEQQEEHQRQGLREMVNELVNVASVALIMHVPQYSSYIMNHIDRAGPTWMPGGAGGGGEWKAIVGIKEGTSRHPIYVEFGTGIYAGKGLIFAHGVNRLTGKIQKVMAFEKHGEPTRFRYWVRGQKGQHYFYETWRTTNAIAAARVLGQRII